MSQDPLERFSEKGRASAEDLAIAASEEFGGAKGLARIWKTLLMAPGTQPATKARILGNIQQLLENTSKLYGDRAKLAGMNKTQLGARIVELLVKHGFVVPIQGIELNANGGQPIQKEEERPAATEEDTQPGTGQGKDGVV